MITRASVTLLLFSAMLLTQPSSSVHAATYVSPRVVAIKLSDLPKGFKQSVSAFISNAGMSGLTHLPTTEFDNRGRITGYQAIFVRKATHGYFSLVSDVYVYKSVAGARWDYARGVRHDLAAGKRVSSPVVGAESTALVAHLKSAGGPLTVYVVDFYLGSISAAIGVAGYAGRGVRVSDAYNYAQIVDGRIIHP
jgi:hypothetical protein